MAGNSAWQRMENLIDNGHFTHETLLNEIMHALSSYEADSIFDHIERMHGISVDDEEEEEEDEDIDDSDLDDLFGLDEEDADDDYADAPDGHAWDKDGNLVKTVLKFEKKE
jgi:hypothetical protein